MSGFLYVYLSNVNMFSCQLFFAVQNVTRHRHIFNASIVWNFIQKQYRLGAVTYIDGLVQDRSNSIANTLELLQSGIKPSI